MAFRSRGVAASAFSLAVAFLLLASVDHLRAAADGPSPSPGTGTPPAQTQSSNFGTQPIGLVQMALSATGGGGAGTYVWSLASGTLPPGLSIRTDLPSFFSGSASAGLIGVATTPGTYNFTLRVTSNGEQTDQASSMIITAFRVKDTQTPDAFVGTFYSYQFTTLDAGGPVTFTPTGGVPAGMSLSASGVLSGTPTSPTSTTIGFNVTDGTATVFRNAGLTVSAIDVASAGPATAVLPNVTQNVAYSTTVTASGGAGGYTYTASGLPSGLSINSTTGVISGTATGSPGSKSQVSITAKDSLNVSYQKRMALTLVGSAASLPTLGTALFVDDFTVGVSNTRTISASSGAAPYSWSVTGLPAGITFRTGSGLTTSFVTPGDVELVGAPAAAGTFPVTVTLSDGNGASVSNTFPLIVGTITQTDNLINGTLGVAYSKGARVVGGTPPYTMTVASGFLPAGLNIAAGTPPLVSGTPAESGNFSPQLTFTDSLNQLLHTTNFFSVSSAGSGSVSISSGASLNVATTGSFYSNGLSGSGGSLAWTLINGSTLPPGLGLSAGGSISGTPTVSGTYTFTIQATDTNNAANFAARVFTLNVTPITVTTSSPLPYGNVGVLYSKALVASGGTAPYTWTMLANNYPPPGLTLASDGTLSGTPTATGQYTFLGTVADNAGHNRGIGFTVSIYPFGQAPPVVQTQASNLGTVSVGVVQTQLIATGGDGSYVWSVSSGSLPPGLVLRTDKPTSFSASASAGIIGLATTPGTYNFTLRVTSAGQQVDQASTLKITGFTLRDQSQLPDAFVGTFYTYTFTPINNGAGVTFTPTSGVPAGMSLSAGGVLSGTPTSPQNNLSLNFTINDGTSTVSKSVTLTVSAIKIVSSGGPAPGALPNAPQSNAYSTTLTATGGTGSYTWSASNLPFGLNLDQASGLISGTPTSNPGKFQLSVTARDTNNVSYTKTMSIMVTSVAAPLPSVTVTFTDCSFGVPCSRTGTVGTGGTPPFSWSVTNLPLGMSFRTGSGTTSNGVPPGDVELWGTPLVTGTFNVQLQVTDANGRTGTNTFPLRISTLSQTSFGVNGTIGSAYSTTLRAVGGALPYSVALTSGSLPAGLGINATTLVLSGTPQESGSFSPVFTYTDNVGETLRLGTFFNINGAGNGFVSINTNANLGSATVGGNVSTQLSACCANSIVWSLTSGTLPTGVSLSPNGLLSGPASSGGVFTFLLKATDGGNSANFAQRQFTFTVSPLSFGFSTTLPFANVGTLYTQTLTAAGGTGAVTWTLGSASFLPPGLSLASDGTLTGTPTFTGSYSFTVVATDTAAHVRQTSVSLLIFAAGEGPPLGQQQASNFGTWTLGSVQTPLIGVGGNGTFTWSVISGALPPGISLRTDNPSSFPFNASAGLVGVATTPGIYNFTLRVSSQAQNNDVASTMKITAFRIKGGNVPAGTAGQPYSYTLTALDAAGPVTWSPVGSLPSGLFLSAGGVLSGTPTNGGFFTVSVTDGVDTVTHNFDLDVPPIRFTSSRVLPNAVQGSAYTTTITATGGTGSYTFSTFTLQTPNSSGLPTGLTLNGATGVISGTPTSGPGIYQVYLTVTDSNNADTTLPITIDVIGPSALPPFIKPEFDLFTDCVIGEPCGQTVAVDKGGVAPFSWSASGLPSGMSLRTGAGITSSETAPGYAELFGSPGTLGTFQVQFTVTDATGATSTNTFPLTITGLSPDEDNDDDANLGSAYLRHYRVIGGTGPYTVTLGGHSYPAGLTLNALTLSGTTVEDGVFFPVLNVGDSAAHTFRGVDFVFVAPGGNGSVNIATRADLGSAVTGAAFSKQLDACCAGTINWTLAGGSVLPTGMSLSSGGVLSGPPTAQGVATFLVQAADSVTPANRSVRQFTLNVTPMAITTASPVTSGNIGTPYSQSIVATGGTGAVTWALAPFTYLPPGVSLGSNGTLTGTPTARGQFIFTVVASDTGGHNVSGTIGLTILGPLNTAPTISAIGGQATNEDTPTGAIAFTIGDAETAAGSLSLSATSSNTTLVPNANILLGGAGTSRTITLTPAANQFGASTITVTVGDGEFSTPTSFLLTVNSVDDAPTITALTAQTVNVDTATGALAFTIGDIDTAVGSLTLSGSSSNTTLVPNANIVFGGSGAGRTVTVTPASGQSGTATITVTVGDGTLTASTGFVLTVNAKPTFSVDKASLIFAATSNGSTFTSQTGEQVVHLLQSGSGTATWTATSNKPWLTVTPASGTGTANLKINVVFASGLAAQQAGAITITLTGAGNTAGPVAVTLNTVTANTNTAPQGAFDTPGDGDKNIAGSIAVTGWAVDDVEVTRVRILRDPVGANEGTSPVFIGNAVLVDGARPDVAALFPNLPKNSVAGWGYLMLTNFLPSLGNGTFKLYAIADDADGHSTILGTKTITCNNSQAVTPTGAIDTPAQGEVVNGIINNFGWVLSPGARRADPPSGGSVRAVIDGAFLPQLPAGWVSRPDLSALFPIGQFSGIDHALGVLTIDTTKLTNGVHTISWLAIDNSTPPQASGIGSRYFTVANGALKLDPGTSLTASAVITNTAVMSVPANASLEAASLAEEIAGVTAGTAAIEARKGFDTELPFTAVPVVDGRATIATEELGRVELRLEGTGENASASLTGYVRTPDGQLKALPIGSSFDPATGVFTWMPGVGFIGAYDLVFVHWDQGRLVGRQEVRIVLVPKG